MLIKKIILHLEEKKFESKNQLRQNEKQNVTPSSKGKNKKEEKSNLRLVKMEKSRYSVSSESQTAGVLVSREFTSKEGQGHSLYITAVTSSGYTHFLICLGFFSFSLNVSCKPLNPFKNPLANQSLNH